MGRAIFCGLDFIGCYSYFILGVEMNRILKALLFSFLVVGVSGVAQAQSRITKDESQALVKKIIAYAKANGKEKAIAAGNSPEFFVKDDGYIFAYDTVGANKGVNLIHKNEKMRGKNLLELKDGNGFELIKAMLDKCASPEKSGWIKYGWPNAVSKKVEPKESYAEFHDGVCYASGFSTGA
jgi:cytochrome c